MEKKHKDRGGGWGWNTGFPFNYADDLIIHKCHFCV